MRGTVFCVVGDNLGSHCIGGFVECFNADYLCCYCLIRKHEFRNKPFSVGQMRTKERYDWSCVDNLGWCTSTLALIYTNDVVANRCIGRHGPNDKAFLRWLRELLISACAVSFLRGFVKERVFVPPMPINLPELKHRITEAVTDMLVKAWEETAYRLDPCRVINGSHIEHL
ncbi:hypothetical protein AVEN_170605-1 [Araneus ventricosus]|uniref:Uncharacterized protein n=1 Tax=Araneus ventricosus TaxID=182803 RepID=A0A4Y2J2C2_ARAVE|nr:hypothetical protein AVEN_170605-1 [Araneus ventricosus]